MVEPTVSWCDLSFGLKGCIAGLTLHGSATKTYAVRTAIQRSQVSLGQISKALDVNPKTLSMWRKRAMIEDLVNGSEKRQSTVPTEAEGAMFAAFQPITVLPLVDCFFALKVSISHLIRSAFYRYLRRHGFSFFAGHTGRQAEPA